MVSRLVYEHFVLPIDREKDGLVVTHIDGDGRNNHYKNLIAVSWGEIRRIAHASGRQRSGFATMSQERLRKIHKILSEKGKKPIQQISASGKVLKNYASIADAADDIGCDRNYMTHVLKGRKTHVRGKFFRYKE